MRLQGRDHVLTGQRIRALGRMQPAAKGERVLVRFFRDGREVRTRRVTVGAKGAFRADWRSGRPGKVHVVAIHPRSEAFERARSDPQRVTVLRPVVGAGARGPVVALYQRGLARLAYAVSRSGRWDGATARASMAYRKVNGMPRRFAASPRIVRRVLEGKGAFRPRRSYRGRHVEADLSRQVMALVRDGTVRRIYHISSGAPATPTVVGTFRVYRKDPGTNALGMVHSTYFIRGYAIHGYKSVPPWNASHGCLRVPIPDAWFIYEWVRMGDRVVVYP
jgi:lipoprotein-anchoring transpeptidase ErfK/SrfK